MGAVFSHLLLELYESELLPEEAIWALTRTRTLTLTLSLTLTP